MSREIQRPVDVNIGTSAPTLAVPHWTISLLASGIRHWLSLLTTLTILYVGLSFLAPVAMHQGQEDWAHRIYRLYALTCHQWPGSSFWLFGTDGSFKADLDASLVLATQAASREYIGNAALGFKSGMCWRTLAIYGTLALSLLAYRGMRRTWMALPLWAGLLLALPMAADGFSQLLGLRESNLWLRLITGALFGLGVTWALVPRVDAALRHVAMDLQGQ